MTADIDAALRLCVEAWREALGPAAARTAASDLTRLAEVLNVPATALLDEPGPAVPFRPPPSVAEGHAIAAAFFRIRDAKARSTLLALADRLAE